MEISNPLATGHGIQLSEALGMGGMVTGLGMVIVFSVLATLMVILMLFKVIFARNTASDSLPKAEEIQPAPASTVPAAAAKKDDMDEEELIAVLTAAVAASLNTSTYNLKIKSYRRIDNKKPAWNKAGIRETINSRF